MGVATWQTASAPNDSTGVNKHNNGILPNRMMIFFSAGRRVPQFRRNFVRLLKLRARLRLLSFLMKSQSQIIMRFGIPSA